MSVRTLNRWASEGRIQAVQLPTGKLRYEPAEIQRIRETAMRTSA